MTHSDAILLTDLLAGRHCRANTLEPLVLVCSAIFPPQSKQFAQHTDIGRGGEVPSSLLVLISSKVLTVHEAGAAQVGQAAVSAYTKSQQQQRRTQTSERKAGGLEHACLVGKR